MAHTRILIIQPPSPPGLNVKRDLAGGFGVANRTTRKTYGHDSSYPTMPHLSLLYLAALLERAGRQVAFVDGAAEQLDENGVERRVDEFAPDAVVFLVNLPSLYADCELAHRLKSRHPAVRFIGVGVVGRALDDELLRRGKFDHVVRGDTEVVVPNLLDADPDPAAVPVAGTSHLRDGVVERSPDIPRLTNLAALPWPAYHLAPMNRYWYQVFGQGRTYATVQASKGCPFTCYYCPYPLGFGSKLLQRAPEDIVNEVECLLTRFRCDAIYFRDQVFAMKPNMVMLLCEEILRRGLKFEWVVETRLDSVNKELLSRMRAAGCRRIHFGLETGDAGTFETIGKDHVRGTLETLSEQIRTTERSGISAHAFILIGLIGESQATVQATKELISRVKPSTLQVSIVTPYPGTDLFRLAEESNLILTRDWSQYTGFDPVMRTHAMSADDLLAAQDELIRHHRRAVRWHKVRATTRRAMKYLADGSLPRRVLQRYGHRLPRLRMGLSKP